MFRTPPRAETQTKLDEQRQSRQATQEEKKEKKGRSGRGGSANSKLEAHRAKMLSEQLLAEGLSEEISRILLTHDMGKDKFASRNIVPDFKEANVQVTRTGRGSRIIRSVRRTEVVAV